MDLRCVLFDFDGVIADTEPSNAAYLNKALAVFGLKLTPEHRQRLVGTNDSSVIESLLKNAVPPISLEQLAKERKKHGNTYENSPTLKTQPGFRDFLQLLHQEGIKTGLVSSTSSRLILAALNRLSLTNQFDVVLCGDMVRKKKPDPEGYQRAMSLLGVRPESCVIIEDSLVGIRAGTASGAFVLAYEGTAVQQDTSLAQERFSHFRDWKEIQVFRDAFETLKD